MSNITVTIAEMPATSGGAVIWEGEAGTTVSAILSDKNISASDRVVKFNSQEVSLSSAVNTDGMLTVTKGAKGNS